MREIVLWRWIFGLAFVPAAWLTWFFADAYPDEGIVSQAFSFIGVYLISLLVVTVLAGIAMAALDLAFNTWDFMLRLLGLRDE